MSNDYAVPISRGDLGGQQLAFFLGEILFGGNQQAGVGVELHKLTGELLQQMIGHDVERLLDQPGLLEFHAGSGHREGLAGADDVAQERVAGAHDPPHRVFLVRAEPDGLVHAGEIKMRAIEQAGPKVVVGIVVTRFLMHQFDFSSLLGQPFWRIAWPGISQPAGFRT
jgi:hypothetical protein